MSVNGTKKKVVKNVNEACKPVSQCKFAKAVSKFKRKFSKHGYREEQQYANEIKKK